MTQIDLIKILQTFSKENNTRVFSLRDVAGAARVSRPAAGMALIRAEKKGVVSRTANVWFNRLDPPELSEIAFSLESPSYLSFESALYRHGILSQAPRGALTVATRGRPRRIETPLGTIRFIHLKPSLFFGYDPRRIATPEKAWLDLLYIRRRIGEKITERFYLKELNQKKLKTYAKKFPDGLLKN